MRYTSHYQQDVCALVYSSWRSIPSFEVSCIYFAMRIPSLRAITCLSSDLAISTIQIVLSVNVKVASMSTPP